MRIALAAAFGTFFAFSAEAAQLTVPSGTYQLDPAHASLVWKIKHLGLSRYTARFNKFDATITLDAENPTGSEVTATIDPSSVDTDFPFADQKDFNAELTGEQWFNIAEFPEITFQSTELELTGDSVGTMTGDLTFLGVTRPVTLDVTLNGQLEKHPFAGGPAIGFSATSTFKRTDFGFETMLGPIVGDEVTIQIEAEFVQQAS